MKTIKVKSIGFKATFKGNGCVNFDCNEQKFELQRFEILKGKVNDNVNFAKKVYYPQEDGSIQFHYKVSAEALRHEIFKEDMPYINPIIQQIPSVFYDALGTPAMLSRGYMFANEISLKRKSPLTITDAEEVGAKHNAISIDFHTRSGAKNTETKGEEDKKDTTLYSIENVGRVLYESEGFINLQELQFISADPLYDRMGIDVDGGINEQLYLDSLKRHLPSKEKKFGYYYIKNSITADEWAERGVLLNSEDVDYLVKYLLRNILHTQILRRNAMFAIDKLAVSFDGGHTYEDITLDNLNDFYFEVVSNYIEASEEKILNNKQKLEEIKQHLAVNKKSKKK